MDWYYYQWKSEKAKKIFTSKWKSKDWLGDFEDALRQEGIDLQRSDQIKNTVEELCRYRGWCRAGLNGMTCYPLSLLWYGPDGFDGRPPRASMYRDEERMVVYGSYWGLDKTRQHDLRLDLIPFGTRVEPNFKTEAYRQEYYAQTGLVALHLGHLDTEVPFIWPEGSWRGARAGYVELCGEWYCTCCRPLDPVFTTYAVLHGEKYVKIGKAKDVRKRIVELQTACPERLELVGTTRRQEKDVHADLEPFHYRGEWFNFTSEVRAYIMNNFALYSEKD